MVHEEKATSSPSRLDYHPVQSGDSDMSIIDIHHHVYPTAITDAIERCGGDPAGWYVPAWTVELDQEIKSATDTKTAILSVTAPGPCIEKDPKRAAGLARQCNLYCASLRDADPSGYGFFASLPSLFDTEAALNEIRYAFDILKADGVTLFTRYGDGHTYLGSEAFRPVWNELSRRKAVVFIHPTHPVDTTLIHPSLPPPMCDYPHETGRAAIDLLVTGTLRSHPGCKIILSHAGGTLPYLVFRVAAMLPYTPMSIGRTADEIIQEARDAFWFDTSLSGNEITLDALFSFAEPTRVMIGTDFPNAPRETIMRLASKTKAYAEAKFDAKAWKDVQYGNAVELFPRLADVR